MPRRRNLSSGKQTLASRPLFGWAAVGGIDCGLRDLDDGTTGMTTDSIAVPRKARESADST